MDGGHETLDDGKVVVDDLSKRSKTVGGARCVGDDIRNIRLVGFFVDAHDEHWRICGWGRDDDLLRSALQMSFCLLSGGEDTGRLDNVVSPSVFPGYVCGVFLGVELDGLAVDNEITAFDLDSTLEPTMLRVVLEHVCSIVRLDKGVVDGDDVYVAMLNGIPEDLCSKRLRDLEGWIWLTILPIRPKPLMPTLVSTILIVYSDQ